MSDQNVQNSAADLDTLLREASTAAANASTTVLRTRDDQALLPPRVNPLANPSNADVMAALNVVRQQFAEMLQRGNDPASAAAAANAGLAAAAAAAAKPRPPEDFDYRQAAFDHDTMLSNVVAKLDAVYEVVGHYFREHLTNNARDRSAGPGS